MCAIWPYKNSSPPLHVKISALETGYWHFLCTIIVSCKWSKQWVRFWLIQETVLKSKIKLKKISHLIKTKPKLDKNYAQRIQVEFLHILHWFKSGFFFSFLFFLLFFYLSNGDNSHRALSQTPCQCFPFFWVIYSSVFLRRSLFASLCHFDDDDVFCNLDTGSVAMLLFYYVIMRAIIKEKPTNDRKWSQCISQHRQVTGNNFSLVIWIIFSIFLHKLL